MKRTCLKTEHIPIEELKLYERNPRRITRREINKLMRSMKQDPGFFEARPCLVNRVDGELLVYAGNQRVKAAKKLGWEKIPCFIEDSLKEEVMLKRLILDNRHNGEWDYDLLASDYEILDLIELGFTEKDLEIDGETDSKNRNDLCPAETDCPENARGEKGKDILCPNCGHVFEET